ncbi:MAG: DUF4891 domain-containing protein [Bacteroides uniformis]
MKTLLVLFLFLLSLLSCQDTNRSGKDVSEDMEEPVDTTPKATAIFWVDKDKDYQAKKKDGPLSLRTVKARVEIDSLGKVNLLAYTKPQSQRIKSYLQYRLEEFRVKKVMLDSGFVKPGVQYVQLRYLPRKTGCPSPLKLFMLLFFPSSLPSPAVACRRHRTTCGKPERL